MDRVGKAFGQPQVQPGHIIVDELFIVHILQCRFSIFLPNKFDMAETQSTFRISRNAEVLLRTSAN